jgi:hypothetical protein
MGKMVKKGDGCEEGATSLPRTCSKWSSQLSAATKFCSDCAHPVAVSIPKHAFLASELSQNTSRT